jgi:hypothetical protein
MGGPLVAGEFAKAPFGRLFSWVLQKGCGLASRVRELQRTCGMRWVNEFGPSVTHQKLA